MNLFKIFTFDAAHKLPQLPPDHKCSKLHGHTFKVEVHINGPINEEFGWVVDYKTIKELVSPIINQLDHTYLNDIKGLENPTTENIAKFLWKKILPIMPILCKIIVQETPNSGAIYSGE